MFSSLDSLSKVETLALAPLYLRLLFFRLDECTNNIVKPVGRYHVVTHADTALLQVLLWERFRTTVPKNPLNMMQ